MCSQRFLNPKPNPVFPVMGVGLEIIGADGFSSGGRY